MIPRNLAALLLVAVGAASVLVYQRVMPAGEAGPGRPGGGPPGGFRPGGGRGAFGAQPMRVNSAGVVRTDIAEQLQIVGNLIGAASVEVAPKINGRLRQVDLRLGDAVTRGQEVARVEDDELRQQVNQAEASYEVAGATVTAARGRPGAGPDHPGAVAEPVLPCARVAPGARRRRGALSGGQCAARSGARAVRRGGGPARGASHQPGEHRHGLAGRRLHRPALSRSGSVRDVEHRGGVGGRHPAWSGWWPTWSSATCDWSRRACGHCIGVDAFPGESFEGRVARIAPVLDPATRTAEIEIEVPNPDFRLKPGMYARVSLVVGNKSQALVVPREAVVIRTSARGVFRVDVRAAARRRRSSSPWSPDWRTRLHVEVLEGLSEGDRGRDHGRRGPAARRSDSPGWREAGLAVAHLDGEDSPVRADLPDEAVRLARFRAAVCGRELQPLAEHGPAPFRNRACAGRTCPAAWPAVTWRPIPLVGVPGAKPRATMPVPHRFRSAMRLPPKECRRPAPPTAVERPPPNSVLEALGIAPLPGAAPGARERLPGAAAPSRGRSALRIGRDRSRTPVQGASPPPGR